MSATIQRACPRTAHQVPIRYALLDTNRFHPTRTYDVSSSGLCYETHEPLKPGTDVCIVMENYAPGRSGLEGFRSYVASIRWTQLLSSNGTERYATGARFITCSHDLITTETQLPHHICDLCGTRMPLNKMEATLAGAQLCASCNKHYHSIPSAKIRRCVERFMVGNVV
jgi:ribosomal protein L32